LPCSFMQRLQYSALLRVCTWLLRGGRAPTRRLRRIETATRRAFCREEQRAGPDRKGPEVRSHPAAALFDATAMPPPRWNAGSEPGAIPTPEPVKAHQRATLSQGGGIPPLPQSRLIMVTMRDTTQVG
jgi:hypothetical protein